MANATPTPGPETATDDLAARIARQTLASRGAQYASEVRRLLDAGLAVMRRCGTTASPRVADIVTEAGLSNDAFYRHFASKEALMAAILEDGSVRLLGYLEHQMAKETTATAKVHRWVEGVMAQATDDDIAATTLAVLWNAGTITDGVGATRPSAAAQLAPLLHQPFADLGSTDPMFDASLAAHATIGRLSDLLWARTRPNPTEIAHIVKFCVGSVTPRV